MTSFSSEPLLNPFRSQPLSKSASSSVPRVSGKVKNMCVHGVCLCVVTCVYMYVLCVYVSVGGSTAFLAQLYFQGQSLPLPSGPGPGSVCPLLVSPLGSSTRPRLSNTYLLVFSSTSTFFRSSRFSVEQDSTLPRGEEEANLFYQ